MGYCDTRCTKLFGKPKLTNPILPNFIRRFSGFVNFCCRISFGSGNIFRPYPQITYFSGGVDSWEGFDCWVSLMNGPIFLSTNRFRCLWDIGPDESSFILAPEKRMAVKLNPRCHPKSENHWLTQVIRCSDAGVASDALVAASERVRARRPYAHAERVAPLCRLY